MTDKNDKIIRHNREDAKQQLQRSRVEDNADNFINLLKQAEKIADTVADSKTFGVAFRDEDGKINKGDIIAAILLGGELGIKPMAAITLGRRLNADSYLKVVKGKSLGLDPMSAMGLISVIKTQAGDVLHTGVHTISKVLLDTGINFKIVKDYAPVYKYYSALDGKSPIDMDLHADRVFILDKFSKPEDINTAKEEGKILAIRKLYTRETEILFKRKGHDDLVINYTLQDATDAGLYRGVTTEGEQTEGKANWNNHPATMLRNRALTIGGRIIAGDKLQGMYSTDEASEFTDYEFVDEDVEDVQEMQEDQSDVHGEE